MLYYTMLYYAKGIFVVAFFHNRDMKEINLLYLLRLTYKGIRELLRTFQGHQMLSQNAFTQRIFKGKKIEAKRTAHDLSLLEAWSCYNF